MVLKRSTGSAGDEKSEATLDKTKNIMFVLIIATALTFLAPMLLGITPDSTGTIEAGDDGTIAGKLENLNANISIGAALILDILKYALLAGALITVVVLRTGRRRR